MFCASDPHLVPASDQGPDSFTIRIKGRPQPLTVKLPLSSNGVIDVLRPLANHIGLGFLLSPHESKDSLLSLITPNLSLLPMADAIARWPQLGEPIPTTTFAAAQEVGTRYKEGEWAATLRETTPQYIPHLHSRMAECKKVCDRLEYEEQRDERAWQELRERFRTHAPAWCMEASRTPPVAASHYVITLAKFEQSHDGYCSDGEELRTEEVGNEMLYLPVQTGWTPADIPIGQEWSMQDECHCCCRAEEKWCVRSCELV